MLFKDHRISCLKFQGDNKPFFLDLPYPLRLYRPHCLSLNTTDNLGWTPVVMEVAVLCVIERVAASLA